MASPAKGGGTKMASSRIEYFASSEGAETFCGLLDYALGVSDEIRFDDAFEILEEGKIKNKSFDFFKIYRVILKFSEEYQSRSNDTGDVSYFLLE